MRKLIHDHETHYTLGYFRLVLDGDEARLYLRRAASKAISGDGLIATRPVTDVPAKRREIEAFIVAWVAS